MPNLAETLKFLQLEAGGPGSGRHAGPEGLANHPDLHLMVAHLKSKGYRLGHSTSYKNGTEAERTTLADKITRPFGEGNSLNTKKVESTDRLFINDVTGDYQHASYLTGKKYKIVGQGKGLDAYFKTIGRTN